jgi:thiazole synthase ThiGH ThiG subunit
MIARAGQQVVESPSVGGGHRTESSLIAGLKVYETAPEKTHVVSAQHVAWVLTGTARYEDGTARKHAVKRSLAQLVPGSDSRKWNEHERDALAAGLTHLWDLSYAPETMGLVTALPS